MYAKRWRDSLCRLLLIQICINTFECMCCLASQRRRRRRRRAGKECGSNLNSDIDHWGSRERHSLTHVYKQMSHAHIYVCTYVATIVISMDIYLGSGMLSMCVMCKTLQIISLFKKAFDFLCMLPQWLMYPCPL